MNRPAQRSWKRFELVSPLHHCQTQFAQSRFAQAPHSLTKWPPTYLGHASSPKLVCCAISPQLPRASTMPASETPRREERDGTLSSLNMAIDALNLARDVCNIAPAQAAFGGASALLTMIRVRGFRFCANGFPTFLSPGHHGQRA